MSKMVISMDALNQKILIRRDAIPGDQRITMNTQAFRSLLDGRMLDDEEIEIDRAALLAIFVYIDRLEQAISNARRGAEALYRIRYLEIKQP